jgi:lysine/ornithine N-monooxygenase
MNALQHTAAPPRTYHSVGIGAGPANLSLAALFQSSKIGRASCRERVFQEV